MNLIQELTRINYSALFISIFTAIAGMKVACGLFEWVVVKLGLETKWMRQKREEHELLLRTSKNLSELQAKHKEDVEQSIAHDERIRNDLSIFMNEMKEVVSETQSEIKQFAENRVHDREQSFRIQEQWTDIIKGIADGEKSRDEQIKALICGSKELLGAEIDRRYREYITLDGIPENEVSEFDDIHSAYNGLKGNHSRDTKYDYVKHHLKVIPVETKLVLDTDK